MPKWIFQTTSTDQQGVSVRVERPQGAVYNIGQVSKSIFESMTQVFILILLVYDS